MTTGLAAGFAKADITPPAGIHLGGYWGRTSGASGVHDALWARALVLGSGPERVGLVALDLVGLGAATVGRMRRAASDACGLAGERLLVCCIHTHAGPLTLPFRGMGEMDGAYLECLVETVGRVVARAVGDLAPAAAAYARPAAGLGINRRQEVEGKVILGQHPAGPTVPYAHVLHLRRPGRSDVVLFSHACHPVVLGSANHAVSADFPGAAVRAVEAATGACALFVNGACGDINPRKTGGTFADVEELGGELAAAVAAGLEGASELEVGRVGAASRRVELPLEDPPPLVRAAAARALAGLRAAVAARRPGGSGYWPRRIPEARVAWARDLVDLARAGRRGLTQTFEIQGLRLGGAAVLGMEGEIFARYQLDLEAAAPQQPTVLVGYANGCVGYVPTADEFERGGYEVGSGYGLGPSREVEAYQVYPSVQMLAPGCEATVRSGAEQVLEELTRQ